MNRLFTILSVVSLLVFHTSCNDRVKGSESTSVDIATRNVSQKVQNLIQRARQGDVEAYKALTLCYRDGDGIEKCFLNMLCMYGLYNPEVDDCIDGIVGLIEEGHPFRLLAEVIDTPVNEETETKLAQLRQLAPAEAKAVEIAKKIFSAEEAAAAMSTFREIEAEGSESAAIYQAIYYSESEDKTGQEECLIRIAEKYPHFNLPLGELYATKYNENEDFTYIQKAVECYYKADAYGMLTPKYAEALLSIYDYFGQKGLLEYDEQEIERLKVLAKRTY